MEESHSKNRKVSYADVFNDAETCDGGLRVTINSVTHEIDDELPALIKNLCFEAMGKVRSGDVATYHFHSLFGSLSLSVHSGQLNIEGGDTGMLSYDYEPFCNELEECGNRFIQFLKRLECNDSKRKVHLNNLINLLQIARDELENEK